MNNSANTHFEEWWFKTFTLNYGNSGNPLLGDFFIIGGILIKRLFITGYKQHELGIFNDTHPSLPFIKQVLTQRIQDLSENGLEWVIISGQLGTELWAAECTLELKKDFPKLQLAILTPFTEQETSWNEVNQAYYQSILERADYVVAISNKPYEAPWQFRQKDQFILQHTDGLLLFYDDENEGSSKFIKKEALNFAKNNAYTIFTITADDIQVAIENTNWLTFPD